MPKEVRPRVNSLSRPQNKFTTMLAAWSPRLYLAAFVVMVVKSMLYSSQFTGEVFQARELTSYLNVPIVALLLVALVSRFIDRKLSVIDGVVLLGCLAVSYASRSVLPTVVALFITAYDRDAVDIRRLALVYAWIAFGFIVLNVFLTLSGLVPDAVLQATSVREPRYGLGFTHPNTLSNVILTALVALYVYRPDVSRLAFGFLIAVALYVTVSIADSRTAACLLVLFAVLALAQPFIFKYWRILRIVALVGVALVVILSFALPIAIGPEEARRNMLNIILSYRIYLWGAYLRLAPFSLFGSTLAGVDFYSVNVGLANDVLIDNAFVYTYVVYGVLYLAGMLAITFLFIGKRRTDSIACVVAIALLVFIVGGFVENYTYNIAYNIYLPYVYACSTGAVLDRIRARRALRAA
jgi:hypothetical protein